MEPQCAGIVTDQQYLSAQSTERTTKKRRLETGEEELSQAIIGDTLTPARHSRADQLAALMVYQAGLPFNFFEKPEVLAFLRCLNSAYTPPKRTALGTTLLDKAWETVKKEVDTEIDPACLSGLSECWGHSCRARAGYIARNAAIGIAQFRRKIDIPLGMAQGAWNAHFP